MIFNALTKLTSENNNSIKNLSETEQDEINKNTEYVRAKGIGIYDSEIFRKDLISMYHERKLRDEAAEDLNTKEFCDSVIENCPKRKYESVFYTLYQSAGTILFWSIFDLLFYDDPYTLHYSTVFLYFLTIVFHFSVYYVFPRFTLPKYTSGVFFLFVVCFLLLGTIFWLKADDYILTRISSGIWFVSHLILFILVKVIWDCYINRLAGDR